MKTESIFLLIHLVSLTLAAIVPAVDDKVSGVADKKDVITSTESVESAESIESLGSNDPKVTSSSSPIEKNEENESAESTDSILSAESTESPVIENDVLKTSSTFRRRYHYPRYPQYYRRPVAYSGYYNRYPQAHSVNRYSNNRPSMPVRYTQPTYLSQYSYSDSDSGSSGGDDGSGAGGCRRKRGARSKRCGSY